jgi:tRNA dimethylallyltransferase
LDDSRQPAIPVICGPTGAGKTFVAHWLAERVPISIVSADSRQLYRGFDIGTAKPPAEERARVPYLGIDVVDPTERASAAWWADNADRWITEIEQGGRLPLVVGGTGLYLRALFAPLFEEPALDVDQRAALERELAHLATEELRRWVRVLDPGRAHLGRTQLLRATEIALLTGQRLSDLHTTLARPARRRARYLVVDPGARLRDDIATRTRLMFAAGWREEVRNLGRSVPSDAPAWNGTGYRTIRALEEGVLTEAAAIEQIITETRQYAKRQRTWFRHQLGGQDVTRVSTTEPDWKTRALAWWEEGIA